MVAREKRISSVFCGALERVANLHVRSVNRQPLFARVIDLECVPWTRRSESDPLAAQKVIHLEA
jgi:hypothetical protein